MNVNHKKILLQKVFVKVIIRLRVESSGIKKFRTATNNAGSASDERSASHYLIWLKLGQ